MLLISVVTIGFLRLMISNQTQATNNDLSQSALDSAKAGVEDAKRALLRYKEKCLQGGSTCTVADTNKFAQCNAANADVVDPAAVTPGKDATSVGEIKIQQTASAANDSLLDQAYTCVTVQLQTEDYEKDVDASSSDVIPLKAVGPYDKVMIQWFSTRDLSSGSTAVTVPGAVGQKPLDSNWANNKNIPPVLRAQFMQFGSNFTVNSFDTTAASGQSNANTIFMYPHQSGIVSTLTNPIDLVSRDVRSNNPANDSPADTALNTPLPIDCVTSLANGGYACKAIIKLPDPIAGSSANRTAYLRLTAFYTHAFFTVSLYNSANALVKLDSVQPIIDSTGRANNLFRRVESRVGMDDFPYPEAAVDVTGNFCKDFGVTNSDYIDGTCQP